MEVIQPHSERPNSENVKNPLILHLPLSVRLNAPFRIGWQNLGMKSTGNTAHLKFTKSVFK